MSACPWEKRPRVRLCGDVTVHEESFTFPTAYLDRFFPVYPKVFLNLPISRTHPGNPCNSDQLSLATKDIHWPAVTQQPPASYTLHVQALGTRECLMCWKFNFPLFSPILLSSSFLAVDSDCLQPLPPPSSLGLSPCSTGDIERVNEPGKKKNWKIKIREWGGGVGCGGMPTSECESLFAQ